MKKDLSSLKRKKLFLKKRKWVNKELGNRTRGKHMSNIDKGDLLRGIWQDANKKFGE